MAEITIKTNGTVEGTTLSVDGKEISKKEKIINIEMVASAPFKSQYSGDTIPGRVAVYYDKANDDGTIKREALVSGKDSTTTGIGQKVKTSDQIVRYIDSEVDREISDLVDRIVDHSEKADVKVPAKEVLLSRTVESLRDKCEDLGIKLEDAADEQDGGDNKDGEQSD
jgi:hypothetical protein